MRVEPPVFSPATPPQAEAVRRYRDVDVSLLLGPAGCGKTHLAVALAMQTLAAGKADKIILSRPLVTAGEDVGFLPGRLEQKLAPWLAPFADVLGRMTFRRFDEWLKDHVEVVPLAFMRGRTFSRCVAILSEAQNATRGQICLFLGRIGPGAKLIVEGDPLQSDLPRGVSFLADAARRLSGLPGVAVTDLGHPVCPRHPLIPSLMERLSDDDGRSRSRGADARGGGGDGASTGRVDDCRLSE